MIKTENIPPSEYSEQFINGMLTRMAVSFSKYGVVKDAYPHKVNALESLHKRLDKYLTDGNTEWLMDAANFLMIEFMYPSHPNAHFKSTDSNESPGRAAYETGFEMTQKDNRELSDDEYKELLKNRGK
jgi:hypothetical protein